MQAFPFHAYAASHQAGVATSPCRALHKICQKEPIEINNEFREGAFCTMPGLSGPGPFPLKPGVVTRTRLPGSGMTQFVPGPPPRLWRIALDPCRSYGGIVGPAGFEPATSAV